MAGDDPVAGGHELDRLHPELDLLADGPPHLLGVADLAQVLRADLAPLGDHLARWQHPGSIDQALLDRPVHQHVDPRLQRAGPDEQRVARPQVGADDPGDLEGVLVVGHRADLGVVEDEVERPADVGVGVAQPGDQRRPGQGHLLDRARVERRRAPEHLDDAVALQQDGAVEGALGGVARAGDDPGVGEQGACSHGPLGVEWIGGGGAGDLLGRASQRRAPCFWSPRLTARLSADRGRG